MEALGDIAAFLVAQAEHGATEEEGGSFLVSPSLGLMFWTLLAFGATMWVLSKFAFPRIGEALEKRANAIRENIEASERTREEADELLVEYRQRLKEAREQADDIVARARDLVEDGGQSRVESLLGRRHQPRGDDS